MLEPEVLAAINWILHGGEEEELPTISERAARIAALDSAEALQYLAEHYNWDDGFEVPTAIADHEKCDLGTALVLFWLADAMEWFTEGHSQTEYNHDWVAFCELITKRITGRRYARGSTSFKFPSGPLAMRARRELEKEGIPSILLTDVEGDLPAPYFDF